MCDCFHLAFPNWHAASSGAAGPGRRLQGPEPATEDDSICDEPSQFTERERPRPQGSSPVEEYPEKYTDSDKECEAEHDPHHKSGTGKKTKKSGLGSMFEKRSTPKMSKLKEVSSPESGVIVKTAKDGCAEGLIYGGGKEGIFIKEVVPESPASKNLKVKEGDQILSATVYFDNMSYEDAIQILEHAQAYKVKLCLKRTPDITETEPTIKSDIIPEEELCTAEMREKGKTKRRGEARISWPKFSSLGKGRKSRFTRSHSSSEADEQRKLELSPTTSDTESPIKTQDALKYKKKHKIKLPVLTKRGRISSSEDQDTDVPTTGQISGDIHQTQESDMLSPEHLESPSGETPEVYVTEDLNIMENIQLEQKKQTVIEAETVQHRAELISIDSTLKTADLTVALADQESPSGLKSPDGKKKKKERSELKMKISGKDKSHKKEGKAKSSPKRLKTLGASFELADHPETDKSDLIPSFEAHTKPTGQEPAFDANAQTISGESSRVITGKFMKTQMEMVIPKVELDLSDVALKQKSPQKDEAKRQKGKEIKQKQEAKPGPTFKVPKIGLSDIATEEVKDDPYERLSNRTQLPKREDIEIPGMEDTSIKNKTRGIKEPKAIFAGPNGDFQAETVQLSIDVDSVKEAVSKLPGYKLPKVDTSGMPIPEEITVIDANAQRISVKTPTKVADTRNLTKFDVSSSSEIPKTTVRMPKTTIGKLTSEELLIETEVDFQKPQKEHKTKQKESNKEIKTVTSEREDKVIFGKVSTQEVSIHQAQTAVKTYDTEGIRFKYDFAIDSDKKSKKAKMMPSFEIARPDIRIPNVGIDLQRQNISEQKGDAAKEKRTIFLQEVKMSKTETKNGKELTGGVACEVKIPEIDGIEYIDSVDDSPSKKGDGIRHAGFDINLHAKPNTDISSPEIRSDIKNTETEEHAAKLLRFGATTPDSSVNVPDGDKAINIDGAQIKTLEREGKGTKFKMPNVGISMPKVKGPKTDSSPSKKDLAVSLPAAKADVQLPEAPEMDVTLTQKIKTEKHELEIIHPETDGEFDRQGAKFKMPKFGIKMPKIKGPEFDLHLSQKDTDAKLQDTKDEVPLPEVPETDVSIGTIDCSVPGQKTKVEKPEMQVKPLETKAELDGQGSKFKIPKLGIKMPKIKGTEFDLSPSKKSGDIKLLDAKGEVKFPDDSQSEVTLGNVDVSIPEQNMKVEKVELEIKPLQTDEELDGQGSKFKLPKLGIAMPKVKGPEVNLSLSKKNEDVTPEAKVKVKLTDVEVKQSSAEVEIRVPEIQVVEKDRHGGKFKIPKFGVKLPKVKGPEYDFGSSKKGMDVQLPEAKADVGLPAVELGQINVSVPEAMMEIKKPELEMQALQTEGKLDEQGEKLKMLKFGIKIPKMKGPEIDLSLSKQHGDVTSQTEIDTSLPDTHKINLPNSQEKAVDELEDQESKFKMSKFEITMPKVKGPEFHLGFLKKDVDITTAESKTDVSLPDVNLKASSMKVEIKDPEIEVAAKDTTGSCSAFKMPDLSMPKIKGPDINLSIPKKEADVTLQATKPEVRYPETSNIKSSEVQIKPLQTDIEIKGQGAKFKMPEFGITIPKVKGPDINSGFSTKDANVTLPGARAEAELSGVPEIAIDMKPSEYEAEIDGESSKFKMPKFGTTMQKVKMPEIDLSLSEKNVEVELPEAKADVTLPDLKFTKPSVEVDMQAPDIKVETKDKEGSSSKFKMPTFKIPKFGVGTPSVTAEVPDMDKGVKIDGADITIPEEVLEVNIVPPSIETKEPSISLKTSGIEHEGKGSKFKLPSLGISLPQAKGPDIDLSLSKKDVDVTLPEAKAEIILSDVELKKPSVEVDIQAPDIKIETKDKKGSPSKFKMPTFKLPKFGVGTPSVTADVPDMDKGVKIDGAEIKIPEEGLEVHIAAPSIETKEPSISLKTSGMEHEGKGSKFKLPSLGISLPQAKGPDIDLSLSKKDVDVTLPEAKAEITLPDVELKKPSVEVDIQAPEIKVETKDKKGSPSKFKMPTFKLPKFGAGNPSVTAEVPDMDKGVKIDGADITIPEEVLEVLIAAPSIETKEPSISLKTSGIEHEGKGSKFKLPSLGISLPQAKGPDIDLSLSKKDVDVTLPEAKAEITLPDVELKKPSVEVDIQAPEIKVETKDKKGSPSKFKMPTFKIPKFGVGTPSVTADVPDMDKGVKIDGADITIPEEVLEVHIAAPSIETKEPSISLKTPGIEHEGKGSKFKLPSLGISLPQAKGPDIDLSLSKKDVDVTLPEAKAEITLPDVELKKPSVEVDIQAPEIKVETKDKKGSPSKFKMPTFKLPKFGAGTPSVTAEVPDMDKGVKIDGADITIPEEVLEVLIAAPSIETKEPSISLKTSGIEHEGKGSKFKLPSLGISLPQAKGPDIDLSLSKKDVDVILPEAKAEITLPDVELKKPSVEVDIQAPEIKVETKDKKGSPSKFKMPTFTLPKFGVGTPSVTADVPDMDKGVKIDGADITIPEEVLEVHIAAPSIETKEPSISLKTPGIEHEGKGSKFKLPSLGISLPQAKGPDIDLSLSKKDVDVTLPEAKAKITLPDVELKKPSVEVDIQAPEIKVETKDKKGSPSKFKMPTFKLPKFGVSAPSVTAEVPDMDKGVKIDGADITIPEEGLEVHIVPPSIETKEPSISLKTSGMEHEGKGSKFKLPSLGISLPQAKGPDIDLSLSKKDVDVILPEAKAEIILSDVELKKPSVEVDIQAPEIKVETKDKKGSPSKFKMPTFKLPKFGVGTPSVTAEAPDMDKGVKIDGADITIPEEVLEVNIVPPSIETKEPSISLKTSGIEHEGKGSKFKLPSLGISLPQAKGPDIDLSLSKKDVDVILPEAKAEIILPDVELKKPSVEVDIQAPEIKVETKDKKGSPSKFKMPTFTLPKFGVGTPSVTADVPDMDKGVKIDGADITIPEEVLEVHIAAPSIETKEPSISLKTPGIEHEGKGSKFKLPSLGISLPQAKGPDIDLSLSKKDVDVTLPEAKAEITLPDVELKKPSVEVDIQAPEIKVETKDKKGSPSKFKMPTFKLPKFEVSAPSVTAEVPDMDKGVKIDGADITIPEEGLEVHIVPPSIETKEPSISLKTSGMEHEGKGSKFKLPSLGISLPQAKGPDIDLSLSKKDVDVILPEAKAEIILPDVELKKPSVEVDIQAPEIKVETKDKKGSPSKFKMPTFKLPKFGVGTPSVTADVPDMDKGVKIDGADIKIPEEVLEVNIVPPSIETKEPSISLKTSGIEHEGKGSKFKLPSLGISLPQAKGPDIDLSLSKKDVDVTLPEAKAEITLPDVELKKPSVEVDIQAPEIKVETKDKKGSPSKFKMPTFKIPKFGVGTPSVTAEVPDMDKGVKIDGADITIPEEVLEVHIAAPSIETKEPSISLKTPGIEHEGKGSKFKLPSLGISLPQAKGPDIDLSLSKKDVDVTLPEAKAEITLPDVELKKPSVEVDIQAPEIKVETKDKKGSPSKFKMPTFKLPKFGVSAPSVTADVPDMDKGVKIDGADITIPEEGLEVHIVPPSIETKEPSISLKTSGMEHEGKGSKFKLPSLGISLPQAKGPDIDLSLSKKDVDVTLPEAKAEITLPDVELKKPSVEVDIQAPEIKVETKDKKGSPSKFKMPTFKIPKFGVGTPSVTAEVPDMDKGVKIDGADITIPEEVLEVHIAAPSIETKEPSISLKTSGIEHEGKGSKFKLPSLGISLPQAKGPDIDLSLSKKDVDVTLPEAKAEITLPDVELKKPSVEVDIQAPEIKVETKDKKGSPSKFKMPTFKLPKFGVSAPSVTADVPDMDKGVKIDGADITIPEEGLEVHIVPPSIETKEPSISLKTSGMEHEGKGSKFKLPSLGISLPQAKGPDIDLSLSKKDVDVTLPEAKAEITLPDVELKKPSVEVDIQAPEIKVETKDKKGSPSKFKMLTFKLPKFGVGTPSVTAEAPDMDKGVKIDGADITIPEEVLEVNIVPPSIETKEPSISLKTSGMEHEGKGSKFKLPSLGISLPQAKGPDIDLSLSKKDVDVTLPEAKAEVTLPDVELKKPSVEVDIQAPEIKVETKDKKGSPSKFKMPTFKLPKFGVGTPSVTAEVPDMDKGVKIDGADITIPEEVLEVHIAAPSIETKEPSISLKTPGIEHEGKGSKFKLPSLGISLPQAKGPDIDLSLSKKDVDVTLPEAKAEVTLPDVELKKPSVEVDIQAPEIKVETKDKKGSPSKFKINMPTISLPKFGASTSKVSTEVADVNKDIITKAEPSTDAQGISVNLNAKEDELGVLQSKFKMPSLGISVPTVEGPETDLSLSRKDIAVSLSKAEAEGRVLDVEVKEVEGTSSVAEISTIEFKTKSKQPSWTFPKLTFSKTGGKAPDVDVKLETPKSDSISAKGEISLPDPRIKGPSMSFSAEEPTAAELDTNLKKTKFSLPRFSFSKSSTKELEVSAERLPVDVSASKGKLSMTSFGEILKTTDVEFDVSKTDKVEENLEISKEVQKVDEPTGKPLEIKEKETNTKSPERTGWFKFPKFGLSSPLEPLNSSGKDDKKDERSPVGGTADEEISPTCSVQSSDAFADISSTITSEHAGPSISSPTKVTVKYSEPNIATGLGETHSNIITSTTRTELISVEPNLPEKITILSSGVSSSSEDTVRLESGKLHKITTNIQAIPEAQHAMLLTDIEIAGGIPLKSEANETISWTVEDSGSGSRAVFERHLVRETSSERSESRETVVTTKQITHVFDASEPISGETASSIQRLRDTVHSEKMKFFDDTEK